MDTKTKSGVELISEERKRQVEVEGWDEQHDDSHDAGEMAMAAICYLNESPDFEINISNPYTVVKAKKAVWPWNIKFWKPTPKNRIKELVKAGALIAAEIDRINRQNK